MAFRRSGVRLPPGPPLFRIQLCDGRYHVVDIHPPVCHSLPPPIPLYQLRIVEGRRNHLTRCFQAAIQLPLPWTPAHMDHPEGRARHAGGRLMARSAKRFGGRLNSCSWLVFRLPSLLVIAALLAATFQITQIRWALAAGNYATTVAADSPVGYWRLDEASGSTAADFSGTHSNPQIGRASCRERV